MISHKESLFFTDLKVSVGSEVEVQSLVEALDPNPEKRNKTQLNLNNKYIHIYVGIASTEASVSK